MPSIILGARVMTAQLFPHRPAVAQCGDAATRQRSTAAPPAWPPALPGKRRGSWIRWCRRGLEELAANPEQQELMAALAVEGQAALTARERRAQAALAGRPGRAALRRGAGGRGRDPAAPRARRPSCSSTSASTATRPALTATWSRPRCARRRWTGPPRERCVALLAASPEVGCVDITGGAPRRLNPQFRFLVRQARALGREVHVVASLPCYSEANVDTQRGRGVFDRSILGLQRLNAAGYGVEGSGLQLDLVYNPGD
eukprot:jgi/Tetstr1/460861/TSEL_006020.t1